MHAAARSTWSDVRLGMLVLACALPVAAGVFWLDEIRRLFVEGPELVVTADEIQGLAPGDPVWVAGRPAGRVAHVAFVGVGGDHPGRVALRLVLRRDAAPALRRDAEARIGSGALLAPPVVKLSPGTPDAPPYDFSDTLAVTAALDLEDFRTLADSGRTVLVELRTATTELGREFETGSGTLPRLHRDPSIVADLARQRVEAARLREAWSAVGIGTAWRDTALRREAAAVSGRLRELSAALAPDSARDALPAALRDLRTRADRLSRRLDAADGTLGRMATDDELRRQTARTRALLDSLLADAHARPLRFLHFRLF